MKLLAGKTTLGQRICKPWWFHVRRCA